MIVRIFSNKELKIKNDIVLMRVGEFVPVARRDFSLYDYNIIRKISKTKNTNKKE